jgi:hypothetical protein
MFHLHDPIAQKQPPVSTDHEAGSAPELRWRLEEKESVPQLPGIEPQFLGREPEPSHYTD